MMSFKLLLILATCLVIGQGYPDRKKQAPPGGPIPQCTDAPTQPPTCPPTTPAPTNPPTCPPVATTTPPPTPPPTCVPAQVTTPPPTPPPTCIPAQVTTPPPTPPPTCPPTAPPTTGPTVSTPIQTTTPPPTTITTTIATTTTAAGTTTTPPTVTATVTATNSPITPPPKFVCPEPYGKWAHEHSCTSYYYCLFDNPKLMKCPKGKYFNEQKGKCTKNPNGCALNWRDVGCTEIGLFPVPNSCTDYYVCQDGPNGTYRRTKRSCQTNQYFDPEVEECVPGACPEDDDDEE